EAGGASVHVPDVKTCPWPLPGSGDDETFPGRQPGAPRVVRNGVLRQLPALAGADRQQPDLPRGRGSHHGEGPTVVRRQADRVPLAEADRGGPVGLARVDEVARVAASVLLLEEHQPAVGGKTGRKRPVEPGEAP